MELLYNYGWFLSTRNAGGGYAPPGLAGCVSPSEIPSEEQTPSELTGLYLLFHIHLETSFKAQCPDN